MFFIYQIVSLTHVEPKAQTISALHRFKKKYIDQHYENFIPRKKNYSFIIHLTNETIQIIISMSF